MDVSSSHLHNIASTLTGIPIGPLGRTVGLLEEGATIPFISRYRKEATGGLDEVQVGTVQTVWNRLKELEKRKETILATVDEQGKLTDALRRRIEGCYDSAELEDIYLPYRPKRRTRATAAREKGLEPLAAQIMRQEGSDPEQLAGKFVGGEVTDRREALEGASDIIAEWISENERSRAVLRRMFLREGVLKCGVMKNKAAAGEKYKDYFDLLEPVRKVPAHRFLAMVRGEREGFLKLSAGPPEESALQQLERIFIRRSSPAEDLLRTTIRDAYKRLLKPALETETLAELKARADDVSIGIFSQNLRQLLLSPPLGQKRVLAVDPGFRTGCKVVCLDPQGNLLHNETVYPHPPQAQDTLALKKLATLVDQYNIEAIAIGDGTAGRETGQLVKRMRLPAGVQVFMVSEDGASVYSASPVGREEFPDYDVTVRGAVSIGRRLIDPLAELIKIDPKSIGVGQYQHDVDQGKLKSELDRVVESCVNKVGVNLNTASKHLLTYVSGLGPVLAQHIVDYRIRNGNFTSRRELLKVPRLGARAFEQCAGFLRIPGAENPLDNSAVHPESYAIVEKMAKDLGATVPDLLHKESLRQLIRLDQYVTDTVGLPTLQDIRDELARPGLDPRDTIRSFEFADIRSLDDLREGMVLPGIVTNMTAFGAFVDIGLKQDGLVHISQLADRFVSNPAEVVSLHQPVRVRVLEVDRARGRINLSLKEAE